MWVLQTTADVMLWSLGRPQGLLEQMKQMQVGGNKPERHWEQMGQLERTCIIGTELGQLGQTQKTGSELRWHRRKQPTNTKSKNMKHNLAL